MLNRLLGGSLCSFIIMIMAMSFPNAETVTVHQILTAFMSITMVNSWIMAEERIRELEKDEG